MFNKSSGKITAAIIAALVVLDALVWVQILYESPQNSKEIYFLDVGQGDAVLTVLPGGVKILTDAGPDSRIRRSLEKVLSGNKTHYIDIAIISHPQSDHFGGFKELLKSYKFGVFLWNGKETSGNPDWPELINDIKKQKIPLVVVGKNDKVRLNDAVLEFISPDPAILMSAEPNDTALVQILKTSSFNFLSTADIGLEIEKRLIRELDLHADILKVGHHGSKYSSGEIFLAEVKPRLAVISVGSGNRYGHPAPETLNRIKAAGAAVLRTDKAGTISVIAESDKLKVFCDKICLQ